MPVMKVLSVAAILDARSAKPAIAIVCEQPRSGPQELLTRGIGGSVSVPTLEANRDRVSIRRAHPILNLCDGV